MSKVVIVVPTYNEKENIGFLIKEVLSQQKKVQNYELHILVSDSHSVDQTEQIVKTIAQSNKFVHLIDVKERGIGVGLLKGYLYAVNNLKADIVMQMDADLQHDPNDIPRFLNEFKGKVNFVQGSRFIKGGENQLEWYRQFFSWGANMVARFLMGMTQIHEFTTSYRAFSADLLKKIDLNSIPWRGKSFIFQPAFLYSSIEAGANIKEIPIIFKDRKKGYSKMDIIGYIKDLMTYAIKVRIKNSKRFIKFFIVGLIGLTINTFVLKLLVDIYDYYPTYANIIGAEMAIISNFILNNFWTFNDRSISKPKVLISKFIQFNLSSLGAIIISSTVISLGISYLNKDGYMLYYFVGVAIGMIWNYLMYSLVIWKKK